MTNIITATVHNVETLLAGKSTFNQFEADEGKLIDDGIKNLADDLQPAATILFDSFKSGASALVGAGLTAIGPILAENSETQATQLLNILSRMGVPTTPPLSVAEQAALVAAINGFKMFADRIGLHIMTAGQSETRPQGG